MPTSYQAPSRGDQKTTTTSQSVATNSAISDAKVSTLLEKKGSDVFTIEPNNTLGDAVNMLSEKKIGALLVTDDKGHLVGILSERDIVRKLAQMPGKTLPTSVESVMTVKIETCSMSDSIISVLSRMSQGRFRHMPVVENGKLSGIVTIGDVVNYRLNELELEALQLKQLIVG